MSDLVLKNKIFRLNFWRASSKAKAEPSTFKVVLTSIYKVFYYLRAVICWGPIYGSMRSYTLQHLVISALTLSAQMSLAQSSLLMQENPEATLQKSTKSNEFMENYATDNRLVDYVMDRIVLPNGLTVRRWRWTSMAKALGLDDYPNFGFLAQDVQVLYPSLVFEGASGYLVFDRQELIVKDKSVRELNTICGVFYGCSKYRQRVLMKNQK